MFVGARQVAMVEHDQVVGVRGGGCARVTI